MENRWTGLSQGWNSYVISRHPPHEVHNMQALPFSRVRPDLIRSGLTWALLSLCVMSCAGSESGAAGAAGTNGSSGTTGSAGTTGAAGHDGAPPGTTGSAGTNGGRGGAGAWAGTGGPAGATGSGGSSAPTMGCGKTTWPTTNDQSGSTPYTLPINGMMREYYVNVPTAYNSSQPTRVVFAWHWRRGECAQHHRRTADLGEPTTGSSRASPTRSTSRPKVYRENGQTGWANTGGQDITFLRGMLDRLDTNYCVDKSRIFSVGFSYGGMMSDTIACQMGKHVPRDRTDRRRSVLRARAGA